MSKTPAPCGTKAAKRRHKNRGETCTECAPKPRPVPDCGTYQSYRKGCRCVDCTAANRDRQRAQAAAKGRKPRKVAACGTKSAKARHKARGEECQECAPQGRAKYQCGTTQARRRHARNNETCTTCETAKTAAHEKKLAPCGTRSARQRHRKHGETCATCTPDSRLAPCGTKAASTRHKRRNETCPTCDDAAAARIRPKAPCGTKQARQRHYRAGETCATCDQAKASPSSRPLRPCGTIAAARRHLAHGEPVCEPCRQAVNEYDAQKRRAQGVPERNSLNDLIEEARFLLNAGEGEARILAALGYTGRAGTLRARLTNAGHQKLVTQIFNPWDLAA